MNIRESQIEDVLVHYSDLRVGNILEMGVIRDREPKTTEVKFEKKEG